MRINLILYRLLPITFLLLFFDLASGQILVNGNSISQGGTVNICAGSSITFSSTDLTAQWTFAGGNPPTGTGTNPPPVTFLTAGKDSVVYKSATATEKIYINVQANPVAAFNATPTGNCDNTIQFNNTSTPAQNLSYNWSFGDGTFATLTNPTHQYLTITGNTGSVSETVTLTATNSITGCSSAVIISVPVGVIPDPSITSTMGFATGFNNDSVFTNCINTPPPVPEYTFIFQNNSSTSNTNSNYTIKWSNNTDTSFSIWPVPGLSHTFKSGMDSMIVTVTNAKGCIGTKTYYVFNGSYLITGGLNIPPGQSSYFCVGGSVTYDIIDLPANPLGTIYTYSVDDGSPAMTVSEPPPAFITHQINRSSCAVSDPNFSNSFTFKLEISNACNNKVLTEAPIRVSDTPIVNISVTPSQTICLGNPISFYNATIGNLVSQNGNSCGPFTSIVWEITDLSTNTLLASAGTGSRNGNPLNSSGGTPWTYGNSQISPTFTHIGNYNVWLFVYDNTCSQVDSELVTICVRGTPQAGFTMSQSVSSCGPTTITFTDTVTAKSGCQTDDVRWTINYSDPMGCSNGAYPYTYLNGTDSTFSSPVIRFNSPGIYNITQTVGASSSCTPAIATNTFTVIGPPQVNITPISPMCPGSINPVATVNDCYEKNPLTYTWTFQGGLPKSSNLLSPGTITYSGSGNFNDTLIVNDTTCKLADTAYLAVMITPPPMVSLPADTAVCSGQILTLGSLPVNHLYSYQWNPQTGIVLPYVFSNDIIEILLTNTSSTTQIYPYTLTASAGPGCSASATVNVKVNPAPLLSVNPDSATICLGNSVTLLASGADSYSWFPSYGLNTTTGSLVSASPSLDTVYTVIGTLQSDGCTDTVKVTINVDSPAIAKIIAISDTVCSGTNLNTILSAYFDPIRDSLYNWYVNGVLVCSNTSGDFCSYILNSASATIKLTALAYGGCESSSEQLTIYTYPAPIASFTQSVKSGCGPLSVTFQNTSSSLNNVNFLWNFGNIITSTLTQPGTVQFPSSPNYTDTSYQITLSVDNGCTSSLFLDTVYVLANPKANFTTSQVTGCSPFVDTLINLSLGNDTAYHWSFGDGTTLTTYKSPPDTIIHIYNTGLISTYKISLVAFDSCGSDTSSIDVVVSPSTIKPVIELSGNNLAGCAPFNASFINNTVGAGQIIFDFGDGSPQEIVPGDQQIINHLFTDSGVYYINIQFKNSCTDTSITISINVFPLPNVSFTLSPISICTGETITTHDSSVYGNSYLWNWGDSTTSFGFNSSHIYKNSGTYQVQLFDSLINNFGSVCGASGTPITVKVYDRIPANIQISDSVFCAPFTLKSMAMGIDSAASVQWIFYDSSRTGGPFYSTGPSASYQYIKPGTYSVKLIVQDSAGCSDSTQYSVKVWPTPTLQFDSLNTIYTCNLDTILTLSVNPINSGSDIMNYTWYINDSIQGAGNPFVYKINQLPPGIDSSYNIKVTVSNQEGCMANGFLGTLVVRPLPKPFIKTDPFPAIIDQPDYTFTFWDSTLTNPGVRLLWDFGDASPTKSGDTVIHQYGDTGKYYVNLQLYDELTGCINVGIDSVQIIYVPGYLYVPDAICPGCGVEKLRGFLPIGKGLKDYHLRIFNIWGQLIFETTQLDASGSPNETWNVQWQGQPMKQDAYRWQIEAHYINGTEWKGMQYPNHGGAVKSGFITIIK